jgi:hypothetical protein
MTPAKIIEWAIQAVELAFALLGPSDQDKLARRLEQVNEAKQRVRDRAQAALNNRRGK